MKNTDDIEQIQNALTTITAAAAKIDQYRRTLKRGARPWEGDTLSFVRASMEGDGPFTAGITMVIEKAEAYARDYDALTPAQRKTLGIPETGGPLPSK